MAGLVVATYNLHGGIDGWGRPFDVVAACRRLDADVLVLQETWAPAGGVGMVDELGEALGYETVSVPMATGWQYPPSPAAHGGWGPRRRRHPGVGMRVVRTSSRGGPPRVPGTLGTIGLALCTRLPLRTSEVVDLGQQPGDLVPRRAIVAEVVVDGGPLVVVGTHMSHLRHGSPQQLRRLGRLLPPRTTPAVLAGDMNLWGPPLVALLPGWRRAATGRTWPSTAPVFQIDHVLATPAVRVLNGGVERTGRSDHLPLWARLDPGPHP